MSNREIDFKVLVPIYSPEYQEQKRFTIGELPEVFRHVRRVTMTDNYVTIVYGRTTQTMRKAVIRKEHILSYHYYLNDREFDAALKKEKRKHNE